MSHLISTCLLAFALLWGHGQATQIFDNSRYDPVIALSYSNSNSQFNGPISIQYTQAYFGGNVISPTNASSETRQLVLAYPLKACSPLQHPYILNATQQQITQYYQGKIILTEHSFAGDTPENNCYVGVKAAHVELVGGFMNLVTMQSNSPTRTYFIGHSSISPLNIPTGCIDWEMGDQLIQILQSNVTVMATLDATGPINPLELEYLITMYSTFDSLYPGGLISNSYLLYYVEGDDYYQSFQGIHHPVLLLNESTRLDPCIYRIWGIVCTGGYITYMNMLGNDFVGTYDVFSSFQYLTLLDVSFMAGLTGPMPCEWGKWKQLKGFIVGSSGMTQFTECCAGMTSLEMIIGDFSQITNLPTCLSQLPNIKIISFNTAQITSPMIDIRNWTQLEYFDMSHNQFTGSIPNLYFSSQTLTQFLINDNQLSNISSHAFDNMVSLTQVDIGRNEFHGELPYFMNTQGLTDLGLDYNQFTGGIPMTWNMTMLTTLRASHNQLSGSLDGLGHCIILTYLDLSHNQFNGTWKYAVFQQADLQQIYMSHNNLTWLEANTLFLPFATTTTSKLQSYDLSYNIFMQGQLPDIGPTQTLQVLKLNGCPLLRSSNTPPSLPSYIERSSDQITKTSPSDLYSCPGLQGKNYPLQIVLDASYYGYNGCICDQGTYGTAPDCHLIPILRNDTVDPIMSIGYITDDIYGTSRMSIGIDTAWQLGSMYPMNQNGTTSNMTTSQNVTDHITHIDGSGSNERTMVIYITITLLPTFSQYTDIIDIYEGTSISTTPIVSIRGSYTRPIPSNKPDITKSQGYTSHDPNIVTMVVLDTYATFNFRSRQTSGTHFSANYTLSRVPPAGYYFNQVTQRVEMIPAIVPVFELSNSVTTVIWVVASVIFVITICILLWVVHLRNTVIFKASSVPFCLSILISAAFMSAGSIFYALSPQRGDYVCYTRIWSSTLSLVTLLACLLTKANRIRDIFTNVDLNKPVATNKDLIRTVAMIISCELILLIGLTSSNMSHQQITLGNGVTNGYQVYSCTSIENKAFIGWLVIQLFYIAMFLFQGVYIAFGIRKVPTAFNESSSIVNALYVLTLLSIVLLPINFIVDDNPNALALIRGVGQCLISFSMTLALFGPKLYYVLDGRSNDASMVMMELSMSKPSPSPNHFPTKGTGTTGTVTGSDSTKSEKHSGHGHNDLFNRYLKLESQLKNIDQIILKGGNIEQIMTARRKHTSTDTRRGTTPQQNMQLTRNGSAVSPKQHHGTGASHTSNAVLVPSTPSSTGVQLQQHRVLPSMSSAPPLTFHIEHGSRLAGGVSHSINEDDVTVTVAHQT